MNKKIVLYSCVVIALDQISKALINAFMHVGKSIEVIKNFFYLTYYENSGAAFGTFSNKSYILIILSLIFLGIVYRFLYSFKMNERNMIAFGLLIGGIIGNLIDRIIFGCVKDFLDFYIFNYNFPIFNISDMAIVCGVILLIIAIIKGEEYNGKNSSKKNR